MSGVRDCSESQVKTGDGSELICNLRRSRWVGALVSLFLLTRHDRSLLAIQCENALKLFSMLRFGTLLVIAATVLSGCSIDAESLKDCKDKDGQPLPQWICNDTRKEKSD